MKLDYFVAGTNNLAAAIAFYDQLFEGSPVASLGGSDRMHYWGNENFAFAVATPFDEAPATVGNGMMFGFDVGTEADVTRLYQKVLELGGTCEGKPGPRGPRFTAYARDLDGNKLCFHT
ncbi:MAG: VOC family protein [Pseudomonadota bacterium]|nr:VOC family protein [Pseudomonadota bacterium]